jgi:MFS family permease
MKPSNPYHHFLTNSFALFPALALGLAVAIGNGFARFAYALLLPAMKEQLNWDYAASGWLNTANALGYIIGAISGYWLLSKHSPAKVFKVGIWLTVICTGITSFHTGLFWLTSTRLGSGIGAAWIFSCGGALISMKYKDSPSLLGTATGVYFGGAGIGIILSGILINPIIAIYGNELWRMSWLILGISALVLSVFPLRAASSIHIAEIRNTQEKPIWKGLLPSLIAYFLFACGYIVYMTFIYAWLQKLEVSWETSTWIWTTLGVGILASPFVWRTALTTWNPVMSLCASCLTTLVGTLIPIYFDSKLALFFSAGIFGLGVFIAPSSVAILSRKVMNQSQIAKSITFYTIVFSSGQALGPYIAGGIADLYGLKIALMCGSFMLLLASPIALIGMDEVENRYK